MIPILLAVAALAVQPAPPAPPADTKPPDRARANLASYISDTDYPLAAVVAGEQGAVGFRLFISAEGLVSDCQVTSSSGSRTLDEATCRILGARARFRPARDADGRPTTDQTSGRIRWVLPDEESDDPMVDLTPNIATADYPAAARARQEEGRVGLILIVGVDGRISDCAVLQPSGSSALDAQTCPLLRARTQLPASVDSQGRPTPRWYGASVRWALPGGQSDDAFRTQYRSRTVQNCTRGLGSHRTKEDLFEDVDIPQACGCIADRRLAVIPVAELRLEADRTEPPADLFEVANRCIGEHFRPRSGAPGTAAIPPGTAH
jgi:TonB family protein